LDLKKILKRVLQYITNEGKQIQKEYGQGFWCIVVNTIIEKIIELEQPRARRFFEKKDPLKSTTFQTVDGKVLSSPITDDYIQSRSKIISTFMLSLPSEIYEKFPSQRRCGINEALALFIDEAHLVLFKCIHD